MILDPDKLAAGDIALIAAILENINLTTASAEVSWRAQWSRRTYRCVRLLSSLSSAGNGVYLDCIGWLAQGSHGNSQSESEGVKFIVEVEFSFFHKTLSSFSMFFLSLLFLSSSLPPCLPPSTLSSPTLSFPPPPPS